MHLLPYQGAGWHTKVAVAHLLHFGKIRWSDCKWGIKATSHLPHDLLSEPLQEMEDCWQGHYLRKLCFNSMLGLWCKKSQSWTRHTSREALMALFEPHAQLVYEAAVRLVERDSD